MLRILALLFLDRAQLVSIERILVEVSMVRVMQRQVMLDFSRIHILDRIPTRTNDVDKVFGFTMIDQRAALEHALGERLVLQIVHCAQLSRH